MEGGVGGQGARGRRTVGDVRDEELDDAMDLEIEKVHRTTYRTDFYGGSLCFRGQMTMSVKIMAMDF